ncbi:MAG: hypothetical protein KAX05_14245 [Bacteroidales bacterium]|nr:hypothetical protein [Bacteroidales bacterium]
MNKIKRFLDSLTGAYMASPDQSGLAICDVSGCLFSSSLGSFISNDSNQTL